MLVAMLLSYTGVVLPGQLGHDAMYLPSHAGDHEAESCWRPVPKPMKVTTLTSIGYGQSMENTGL
jgi:hypothetical protein